MCVYEREIYIGRQIEAKAETEKGMFHLKRNLQNSLNLYRNHRQLPARSLLLRKLMRSPPTRMCFSDGNRSCFLAYMGSFNISKQLSTGSSLSKCRLGSGNRVACTAVRKNTVTLLQTKNQLSGRHFSDTVEKVVCAICRHDVPFFFGVCGRRAACDSDSFEQFPDISRLLYLH